MIFKWFSGIEDLKSLKSAYIRLAKQYHPDIGGNDDIMKEINAERDKLKDFLENSSFNHSYQYQTYRRQNYTHYQSQYHSQRYTEPQSLEDLLRIAKLRDYKIGWVAIHALKFAKSYEDCLKIAKACNYKPGWAYYKWQEILNDYDGD